MVLDEALSDLSGWEVLARIRETNDRPVLLLTTPATDCDKLANLDTSNEDTSSSLCPGLANRQAEGAESTNAAHILMAPPDRSQNAGKGCQRVAIWLVECA